MRMNLLLELQDIPGQLVAALEPIANLGANIVTIIHERDIKVGAYVPVQVTIEGDKKTLNLVTQKLTEKGVRIIEMDGVPLKEKINTILIGVGEEELKEIIDRINSVKGVRVADLSLKMSGENSAAKVTVEVEHGNMNLFRDKINEIKSERELLIITEI